MVSSFNGQLLIYMSIHTALQTAVTAKESRFLPMDRSEPVARVMLIAQEVQTLLEVSGRNAARIQRLLADLQAFVRGDVISMCFTPRQHKEAYLGRLEPTDTGCWDVRCRDPDPSLRVFGHFVRPDFFVAIDWWPRWKRVPWSDKEPLLKDDDRWAFAIAECGKKFSSILPGIRPVVSTEVAKHVSEHVNLC